ncbi:MAG: hypothetical protein EXR24_03255 [Ignavibacteria bacterium]|nr:hypothetical protein [Bacteroidota bacterium]MSQ45984.1 hypothetical protein [Ignavibacteria bacterium]
MIYRVVFTKFLDVPKNIATETVTTSEEDAINIAKSKLITLNADTALVLRLEGGESKVIHRFEPIKK